jgi:uncharacterized protein (UPF0332 family)
MSFSECLKKGLITKDHEAPVRVRVSLEVSERFLEQAKGNLQMKYYVACELLAYNSAFHAARALLFSKGFREKSHACLIIALGDLFKNDHKISSLLNTFDQLRLSRHDVQYGGALVTEEKAKFVVGFASEFLEAVREKIS